MADNSNAFPLTPAEKEAVSGVVNRALNASRDSYRNGIAAAIVSGNAVIEVAENEVNLQGDPTKHAEMVLIARVTQSLDRKQLSECTLISSLQPCEMCLSAMRFAGIKRVIFCARQENVATKYFAFPNLSIDTFVAGGTPFTHIGGVMENAVLHLYEAGDE
ncbi:Cytidine and deoxycytidylate deaminase zinc-binding region [Loktanella sp. DSM 29012]|uniref:nucleoside deaminase n=1 Tax=Loktanella sp. DSM 29012 TaxID=1881056 RepID=UPI0008C79CCC|nr:nucleoside deaminase [Loktanella sp. DSM 29012]SEP83443.1 Cytidine and deoxycytidylate deaminase zinc-binding region [Loktanella sp. DSM 29012]